MYSLVVSVVGPRRPSGLPARTGAAYLFCPCLPLPTSLLLSTCTLLSSSQCLSAALYIYVASRLALRLAAGYVVSLVSLCILYSRESLAYLSLAVVALAGSPRLRALRFDGALSHTWAFIMSLILKENSEDLYKSFIIYIKVLDSKRNTRIIHSIEFSKTGPDSSFKSSGPVV